VNAIGGREGELKATVQDPLGLAIYPRSLVETPGTTFLLARDGSNGSRVLVVRGDGRGFEGAHHGAEGVLLCPLSFANAAALRARLPWLRPAPLGLKMSVGFGDRLGLATPGHIRAVRRFVNGEARLGSVFAQQSVRENARTGRTAQRVLDDATWGVFQEGWREAWGADADHLKTRSDVDAFADAGYTLFTVDPGDHVDDGVPDKALEAKLHALPWRALEDAQGDLERRYLQGGLDLGDSRLQFDKAQLWRAAVKYGRAVAHATGIYRHIVSRMGSRSFELELSVDETSSPTTVEEHAYIAAELRRLGVRWVSLAPRFVGRFEKGVDYIGDLEAFADQLTRHAAVAHGALGPYKLSVHSGSDKFSIYPVLARLMATERVGRAEALVHVKTAGTSYLEALRAMAHADGGLFREILTFALERYESDRATYHVSAEPARVSSAGPMRDDDLPSLLDQFDTRQVLHVTFGSVLDRFGERLRQTLARHEGLYAAGLEEHFERHLAPFLG
jgi:hypothetical protein